MANIYVKSFSLSVAFVHILVSKDVFLTVKRSQKLFKSYGSTERIKRKQKPCSQEVCDLLGR